MTGLPKKNFDEWLSAAVKSGELRTVDFLQYVRTVDFLQYVAEGYGDEDEDGEPSGVVMERRIVD